MSTIRQNHQTPFAPPLEKSRIVAPKSLAADYTFSVRKAVKEKPSDQSALELERCERLVQQFVRSSIAMAQSPKVTFSTDEVRNIWDRETRLNILMAFIMKVDPFTLLNLICELFSSDEQAKRAKRSLLKRDFYFPCVSYSSKCTPLAKCTH